MSGSMPPVPTTDPEPAPGRESAASSFPVVPEDFDQALGVYPIFVRVPRAEIAYFRLIVESWENLAVVRTMQRFHEPQGSRLAKGERGQAVVVVLAVPDFIEACVRGLERLCAEVDAVRLEATEERREAVRRDLLGGVADAQA